MQPNKKLLNESWAIQAIKDWYAEGYDYGPSYRDIQDLIVGAGHKMSLGTVHSTCARLAESGRITFHEKTARSIRLKGRKL